MEVSFKIRKIIEDLFQEKKVLGATEISKHLDISRTIIHKALKILLLEKKIKKVGKGAHVKYKYLRNRKVNLSNNKNVINYKPDYKILKILNETFYKFTPEGEALKGFDGIKKWCNSRNLDIKEKIRNYISIFNHIENKQNSCGLLDASNVFGKHFKEIFLDEVYYADQYKWMEFGRGKLAEMTFYAKQSQNKKLINESIDEIFIKLECIITKNNFDAIGITPWSILRKNQLLGFLKERLKVLNLPFVNIIKYYPNNIAIPQKSLKTRNQRILNAKNTIFVDDKNIGKYQKVFLIDDFVGSGSTLNETAKKLKTEGIKEVVGFSFVGNMDLSYEVINEV